MNILIATQNKHKIEKIVWIFENYNNMVISTLSDKDQVSLKDFEESGESLKEIAEKKALFLSKIHPNCIVVATDAGMHIPSIEGKWDKRFTKRFAGESVTDFQRINNLLKIMEGHQNREAIWHEAIALAWNSQILFSVEVEGAKGIIQQKFDPEHYKEGIWLCSLWYFPQFKKNFFEMTAEEQEYAEISWFKLKNEVEKFLTNYKLIKKH